MHAQVQLSDPWSSLSLSSSSNLHPRTSPTQAGAAALRAALGDVLVAADGPPALPGTPAPARHHHHASGQGSAVGLALYGGTAQPYQDQTMPPGLDSQVSRACPLRQKAADLQGLRPSRSGRRPSRGAA